MGVWELREKIVHNSTSCLLCHLFSREEGELLGLYGYTSQAVKALRHIITIMEDFHHAVSLDFCFEFTTKAENSYVMLRVPLAIVHPRFSVLT